MASLLRILAVVLALTSFAAPQVLAAFESDACSDESDGCTDCSTCAVPCACCVHRTVAVVALEPGPVRPVATAAAATPLDEPVLTAVVRDIFQPPRA